MGTKIKPTFKSEYPLASEGWHLFRIVEARVDVIPTEERKEKDGITNDKNFVVRSAVEGGEEDGVDVVEFFANYSKKEFSLSRLAGLMIKTEATQPFDEIDIDTMRGEKFETKFKMSLPKRLFGGRVKHTPGQKREGSEERNIFANIVEYATQKELKDIMAKQEEKGAPKVKTTEKPPGIVEPEVKGDPWA